MTRPVQEALFRLPIVRWTLAVLFLCRGTFFLTIGKLYRGTSDFCWVARVSDAGPLKRIAQLVVFRMVDTIRRTGANPLIESYRADAASTACASLYSIAGSGRHDLFRDLIVLKKSTSDEKGVILLKYARTFDAVVSLFDLSALMERYIFVLEPCWAGYCDPSLLMFIAPGHPVFVQCFTEDDHQFVSDIGTPLVPLRLGPADWVDADLFAPHAVVEKEHDLVMVANWAPHKRHALLFRALRRITDRAVKVLLIGFPLRGATVDGIRREAASIGNDLITVEVLEKLPPSEVAEYVGRCKVFVFLSRKEGDNKALVEAMFLNVPAIVYDKTIGGARSRVNAATGILSSDQELADRIRYMLDHYEEFSPRAWILEHSGSVKSTRILNDVIKRSVTAAGGSYREEIVEKTNSPNLAYRDPSCRARFEADYEFILACRRAPYRMARNEVA